MQWFIFVALPLLCSFSLRAEKYSPTGWIDLFNGKDLKGWKATDGSAAFSVANGQIKAIAGPGKTGSNLMTEKEYADFFLELEFKAESVQMACIQVRSSFDNGKNKMEGPHFAIGNAENMAGGIYMQEKGLVYPVSLSLKARQAYKTNDWNTIRIECVGSHLITFINGEPAAYVIDSTQKKGKIGLWLDPAKSGLSTGNVLWRKIRIRTNGLIRSSVSNFFVVNLIPNELSGPEKQDNVKLLWDGRTNAGWRRAYRSNFPEKGWKMENGILTIEAGYGNRSPVGGGDISTTAKYRHFVLQFEFKITTEANSGVKYFVADTSEPLPSVLGLEYQLLDDEKNRDAKNGNNGNRKLGALYDLIPPNPSLKAKLPVGAWNRGMIIAYPDHTVQHWLNGWKVVEYKRDSPLFAALIAKSKYKDIPLFGMVPEGYISLQDHGYEVSFRSIKIKELDTEGTEMPSCGRN